MAVVIRYNSDILSDYQTFFTAHQVDMIESLAWLVNDEKSMGISEESGNMIVTLAHFYFELIETLRQSVTPTWTYLDWLTQDEYDAIMYKRTISEY